MLDRRRFLGVCSALGVSSTLFPGVLWALAEQKEKVTKQMIDEAALVADVPIADEYKQMMLDGLNDQIKGYEEIFKLHIANSVPPAFVFDPILPGMEYERQKRPLRISAAPAVWKSDVPKNLDDVHSFRRAGWGS